MKKEFCKYLSIGLFTFLFFVSFTEAQVATEVTVQVEHGSDVLVRLKEPGTGAVISTPKITNYGTGVATLNFETSRTEVDLLILVLKNGAVIDTVLKGPYIPGEPITIDLRSKKEGLELIEDVLAEETSEEVEEIVEETGEVAEETAEEKPEIEKSEETLQAQVEKGDADEITGNSIFFTSEGNLKLGYSIVGGVFIFSFLIGFFMMFNRKKSKGPTNELDKLQKEIKKKAKEIEGIKQKRTYKSKLAQAKMELEREEEVLNSLKKDEDKDTESVKKAKIELSRKERILDSLKAEEKSEN